MKMRKTTLLASAAVVALGLGTASEAQAIDNVDTNWTWNITKTLNETVTINDTLDLSGLATIEQAQINVGDVTATASTSDVENNPPGIGEGGTVLIDETITVTSNFDKPVGVGNSVGDAGGNINDDGDTPLASSYLGGSLAEQDNGYTVINDINVQGEVELEAIEGVNDAVDLPKVENIATAVANNASYDGSVGFNLHSGQYNWGGFDTIEQEDIDLGSEEAPVIDGELAELGLAYFGSDVTDNPFHDTAVFGILAGAMGTITQGEVSADATVDGNFPGDISVQNASVENAATAVGNNLSAAIDDVVAEGDRYLVADITQFNYANTTATATTDNVHVDNYMGFGDAGMGPCGGCVDVDGVNVGDQIPLVSTVATAVGNNLSITVGGVADINE